MKFEHDPVKYREMSEPKTEEQAQADAEEFTRGVYELREKLKIADVTIGMSQPLTSGKTFAATAHRGDLFVCAQLGAAVAKALRANAEAEAEKLWPALFHAGDGMKPRGK